MKTYSKEQLISAMALYNADVLVNPEKFNKPHELSCIDEAKSQVEYLLSFIDEPEKHRPVYS